MSPAAWRCETMRPACRRGGVAGRCTAWRRHEPAHLHFALRGADARRDRPQADRRRGAPARDQEAAVATAVISPKSPPAPTSQAAAQAALDLLATMIAVVTPEGECEFANSSFETVLGLSRRSMSRGVVFDWFADPQVLRDTVAAVSNNAFSTSRLEPLLKRPSGESLPVHVTVNQIDGSRNVVFEIVEIEQQHRQEREERALEQAEATKELIRNLAHEIKNPLGVLRGDAQLLDMEIEA